jgi:cation transport regulator ChaC
VTKKYFAYGSNMNRDQIAERCPNYRLIGTGEVEGYRLIFPRSSEKRMCGVASIAESEGESVFGVVFELCANDVANLNKREGFDPTRDRSKNSYNQIDVSVAMSDRIYLDCFTYVAVSQPGEHLPNQSYMALITNGAKEHKLPDDYVGRLMTISTKR